MELNSKEQKTYDTIAKIMNNELTRKEAMFELHKSRQQIYNLIKVYNEQGMEGFVHKNRGRTPANKLNNQLIKELENLYLDEYYDYNFEAFYDELLENKKYKGKYDISYSSLHMYFLNDDIIVNVNIELDKNVNLGIGQFVPVLFSLIDIIKLSFLKIDRS